jgi:hypothetical protein
MNNEKTNKNALRKKSYHRIRSTDKLFTHIESNLKSKSYCFGEKKIYFFFRANARKLSNQFIEICQVICSL